jgi:hypothetical protein
VSDLPPKGVPLSESTKKKISIAQKNRSHENQRGEAHGMWKGDAVGLTALHDYIKARLPRPHKCQKCGIVGKPLDLHNIDKKYTRDLTMWIYLCKKCHAEEEAPAREKCQTEEARIKRGQSLKGHPTTETTRQKISRARIEEWKNMPQEVREKRLKNFIKHPKSCEVTQVPCACGCGKLVTTPDSQGRNRKCLRGHNVTPKFGRKYPGRRRKE